MAAETGALPAYPLMYALAAAAGGATGDPELQFLLYGQAAALTREEPAAASWRGWSPRQAGACSPASGG